MTSYEKRSLYRFLSLYLGSVFILLAIIGYLFYRKNADMMVSAIKYEMFYQERMLESKLQHLRPNDANATPLAALQPQRFKVGYFDAQGKPIFNTIGEVPDLHKKFYADDQRCYSTLSLPSSRSGVGFIVLMETELKSHLRDLRYRIILYLIGLFLFMAVVGFFLSRLFLKPIHERIAALDRFIEDTTHELNTPISAILMTIQGLKGIEPKKLNRLKASAQRLSTMYDTLSYSLSHDKAEPATESFDLKTLLEERIETLHPLAQSKQISFTTRLHPCPVTLPRETARRLVDNLLSNAIKYNRPGGTVTLTLHHNRLSICDTGIGIAEDAQTDIFRRYQRANKEEGGFGIGLSIVHRICEEYAIPLSLDSTVGVGSCFHLDLRGVVYRE